MVPSELLDRLCADAGDSRPVPSVLILAAHPDDEVIGCGSLLMRLRTPVIAHVTDGAPRNLRDARAAGFDRCEAYAAARRRELYEALLLMGIGPSQTREMGYADQSASQVLDQLTQDVVALILELKPEAIVTHPYEGGHPDHDATAFAACMACHMLEQEGNESPVRIEMTSYHNNGGAIETSEFLPDATRDEQIVILTDVERALKQRMFECYRTQAQILRWFPIGVERFRIAPDYDFTCPPHDGVLFYEMFDWGMTGPRWRQLARAALQELKLFRQCTPAPSNEPATCNLPTC